MQDIIEIVKEFKKRVSDVFGEVELILFGSYAKDTYEKESDIDVFVIMDRDVNLKIREIIYDIAYEVGLEYDVVLDVSVYSKFEWEKYRSVLPFFMNIEKEGIFV